MTSLFANYKRLPVAFESGAGCTLTDTNGKKYLDFLSGIAVTSLGHSHPRMVAALTAQVQKLLHVSNLYEIPQQEAAGALLVEKCGEGRLTKAFFCNSGAEANECQLKMARRYAHAKGLPTAVTVFHNGFHGRTLATVSATGTPKYHEGFAPMMPGFEFAEFNDLDGALACLEKSCGVLVEPVQGEGGVIPATPEFLKGLEKACYEQGKLLMLDEVQTGIGRTGRWLAAHHYQVKPHSVSLAKGLGGGVPVGAVLATEEMAELLPPGTHGTTFGGNPLACTAVRTVVETIAEEGLLDNARQMGAYLAERLAKIPGVTEVRGLGLMQAVVLEVPAGEVADSCLQQGLLVNAVRPQVLRIVPPLVAGVEEIDQALAILKKAVAETAGEKIGAAS